MLPWEEKMKLKALISDTVRWMCKDGLMPHLPGEFCVEGLIGVTVGRDELLIVSINEQMCGEVTRSAVDTATPSPASSGHSTKRKITHAPDWSEEAQTATEDANNTKKARYSDSFSESVTSEQTQDRHNTAEIQIAMEDNTAHVQEAGYSESCEAIAGGELIPDKPAPVMSADFLFSTETRSSSVTNSTTNLKSQSTAVKRNSAKDIHAVKTRPPTERRMTRSSRKSASCGAYLEKSAVCGKDINLSALKKTSDFQTKFDENTIAKLRNNCKKTKSSEKTVTKSTKAIDRQKPDESVREELHDIIGISSVSTQKHLVKEVTTSNDDDDRDDAFDDVDDELSADNNGKVAAVETDSLADKSHSLTSVIQTDSRATDQSSASPEKTFMDRNQYRYSTGDEAVGDSVSRNQPYSTVQFNIKSKLLDKAEGSANQLQITDLRQVALVIVKPEPQDDNMETESVDLQLLDADVKSEPEDDNTESLVSVDYKDLKLTDDEHETDDNVEPEPQMVTGQLYIDGKIHNLGIITNSFEYDDTIPNPVHQIDDTQSIHQMDTPNKSVHQIDPVTKPVCQIDQYNESPQQMDKDSDQIPIKDTQSVHQMETTGNSLHQRGETTNSKHATKYICKECGKNLINYYFYRKHVRTHIARNNLNMRRTNSLEHDKSVNQIDPLTKPVSKLDKDNKALQQIDENADQIPPMDENTKAVHQRNTTKKLIPKKGKATFSKKSGTKYVCKECGNKFENSYSYRKHMKKHPAGGLGLVCTHCNLPYIENRFHRCVVIRAGKRAYRCNVCKKMYDGPSVFKKHYNTVHRGKHHKCPHCQEKFGQIHQVVSHIQDVHGQKPYSCLPCGKRFSSKIGLTSHQKGDLGVRHQCPQCNSKFSDICVMKIHIRNVHAKVKTYSCESCGKYFSTLNQLESHRKIHLRKP